MAARAAAAAAAAADAGVEDAAAQQAAGPSPALPTPFEPAAEPAAGPASSLDATRIPDPAATLHPVLEMLPLGSFPLLHRVADMHLQRVRSAAEEQLPSQPPPGFSVSQLWCTQRAGDFDVLADELEAFAEGGSQGGSQAGARGAPLDEEELMMLVGRLADEGIQVRGAGSQACRAQLPGRASHACWAPHAAAANPAACPQHKPVPHCPLTLPYCQPSSLPCSWLARSC